MPKKPTTTRRKKKKAAEEKPPVPKLEQLLELRKKIAARRPRFIRQESWRYKRLDESWRKPKGIDSHMRLRVKGWPKIVNVGYRGPSAVRHLHPSGLRDVLVHNVGELERLNPKTDAARLTSNLGNRKRLEVISRARDLGIRVLNPAVRLPTKTE